MKTHERNALIRQRLAGGDSPTEVARDLGISRATVYRVAASERRWRGTRAGDYSVGTRVSAVERDAFDRLV